MSAEFVKINPVPQKQCLTFSLMEKRQKKEEKRRDQAFAVFANIDCTWSLLNRETLKKKFFFQTAYVKE